MRNPNEIKERIRMALVEDINANNLVAIMKEPENQLPEFLERLTNHIYEVTVDEITYRRRW